MYSKNHVLNFMAILLLKLNVLSIFNISNLIVRSACLLDGTEYVKLP